MKGSNISILYGQGCCVSVVKVAVKVVKFILQARVVTDCSGGFHVQGAAS